MGRPIYTAVGVAPREAAADYRVGSQHDTGDRAAHGAGLLQGLQEGQGVNSALRRLAFVFWRRPHM